MLCSHMEESLGGECLSQDSFVLLCKMQKIEALEKRGGAPVCRQEDSARFLGFLDALPQRAARSGIETRRGLVEVAAKRRTNHLHAHAGHYAVFLRAAPYCSALRRPACEYY
jgi:hypothetical protein